MVVDQVPETSDNLQRVKAFAATLHASEKCAPWLKGRVAGNAQDRVPLNAFGP